MVIKVNLCSDKTALTPPQTGTTKNTYSLYFIISATFFSVFNFVISFYDYFLADIYTCIPAYQQNFRMRSHLHVIILKVQYKK